MSCAERLRLLKLVETRAEVSRRHAETLVREGDVEVGGLPVLNPSLSSTQRP